MKKTNRWLALLLAATLLLGLLSGCNGQAEKASEETKENPTEATDPTQTDEAPAVGAYGENDVHVLGSYSVSTAAPDDAQMKAVVGVDADNAPLLTNSMLQICFWLEFYNFMNSYGQYAYVFGLDITKPLAGQTYPASEDGEMTWEQYYLESATNSFADNYALAQAIYATGYTLSEEDAANIDGITDPEGSMAAEAKEAGYPSVEAYLQENFGDGVSVEAYQEYMRMFYAASDSYGNLKQEFTAAADDAAAEAYYDEHVETYEENRVLKRNNVSVRHILIAPEGEKDTETQDWTEAQWTAAEEKANEVFAEWQQNPTQENFALLAGEYTADGGSKENGGLYEDFATDAMVQEFSDWSFDPSRETGDTAIVRTTFGYHIMYFVEQTDTQTWLETARTDLVNEQLIARIAELREQYPVRYDFAQMRIYDVISDVMAAEQPAG